MPQLLRLPAARRRAMRVAAVAAVAIGALLTIVAWATAAPAGTSADEEFHLGSIWCPRPVEGFCATQTNEAGRLEVKVPNLIAEGWRCSAQNAAESGACIAASDEGMSWSTRFDNGNYPGLYYRVLHTFVGDDVTTSVFAMRIFNGTLAVALLGALAFLLPPAGRRYLMYTTIPLLVVFPIFIIASVNPSSWAVTGVITAFFGGYGVFQRGARSRRIALGALAVVGAVMAAAARADAAAYVIVVAIVLAFMFAHPRRTRATWIGLGALAVFVAVAVASLAASDQWAALFRGFNRGDERYGFELLFANLRELPILLWGYAGLSPLNMLDTPMPSLTWAPVIAVSCAVAWMGLRQMTVRKGIVVAGTGLLFVVLPLMFLQVSRAPVGQAFQARYTMPLIFLLMATILWAPRTNGRLEAMSMTQTITLIGTLTIAHSIALHTQIRRHVTGLDVVDFNLSRYVEWWHGGPSPMVTWLLGTVAFATMACALVLVRKDDEAENAASIAP